MLRSFFLFLFKVFHSSDFSFKVAFRQSTCGYCAVSRGEDRLVEEKKYNNYNYNNSSSVHYQNGLARARE
jgi:hypothetical protein